MVSQTLNYYNIHAADYSASTQKLDFHETQDRFLALLPPKAAVLDFGCGSGRDTKYFLDHGCKVSASDGAEEFCRIASEFSGIPVKHLLFTELEDVDMYDGVWACSSILHLSKLELKDVFQRIISSLHDGGIFYTSFKYGCFEGIRNERYFTDFDEESINEFLKRIPELKIESLWISTDVRPGRGEEKWLNIIMRRAPHP